MNIGKRDFRSWNSDASERMREEKKLVFFSVFRARRFRAKCRVRKLFESYKNGPRHANPIGQGYARPSL